MQQGVQGNGPGIRPVLVGISGGSGAGKTSMAELIQRRFPQDSIVLSQDCYYRDIGPLEPEEKNKINFDHPDALDNELLAAHLDRLIAGTSISVPIYDYATAHRVGTQPLSPQRLILVEGLFLLSVPALREKLHMKIFVAADEKTRVQRIRYRGVTLRRHKEEFVRTQIERYVLPMHDRFIEPSHVFADIVVNNNSDDLSSLSYSLEPIISQIDAKYRHLGQRVAFVGDAEKSGSDIGVGLHSY